jgi:hypothetical protein
VSDRALIVRVGPIAIALAGVSRDLATALEARFGRYVGAGEGGGAALRIDVEPALADPFLEPPAGPQPLEVRLALSPAGTVSYTTRAAHGEFERGGGTGRLQLARTDWEPHDRAVENFLRAAAAWLAIGRGGVVVHAASVALAGRGYLFFGPSGAGKSTVCSLARGGAVLGDDIALVWRRSGEAPRLYETPFRGSWTGPWLGESVPLRAAFRLVHGEAPRRITVPRALGLADLAAVLPFLGPAYACEPVLEHVAARFDGVPLYRLEFREDDSFWEVLEDPGRGGRGPA